MINVTMAVLVVFGMAAVMALVASRYRRSMRPWLWFALAEYVVAGISQLLYSRVINEGSDALFYVRTAAGLAEMLDASFTWSARELLLMLFQQPSAMDPLILVPGTNTGSMTAATAFLLFVFRGSDFAAHFFVTGLSLFSVIAIYNAARDAIPDAPPLRLFAATVLFPSIAFWTSALHKEAFAMAGIGVLMAAWRHARKLRLRALVYGPLGLGLILLFRAPALIPLALGIAIFLVWNRLQRSSGSDVALVGPVYVAIGVGVVLLGMIAASRVSPELSVDRLEETVARRQQNWALVHGGSSFATEEDAPPQTLSGQIMRIPLATLNALFRPQFFDVRNIGMFISAVEMTAITFFILRALRHHGLGGLMGRIQRSPFALMCAVITFVGCTMVGLVTFNFGSLVRYRVPFLPFYGALIVMLVPVRTTAARTQSRQEIPRIGRPPRLNPARQVTRRSRAL